VVAAAWSTIGQAGAAQRTPDLTAIVQRIVSRSNWRSGNALSLIITGTDARRGRVRAASAAAALLHVEYGTAATTSHDVDQHHDAGPNHDRDDVHDDDEPGAAPPRRPCRSPPARSTREWPPAPTMRKEDTAQVSLTSSDLELTVDSTAQTIGMRFRGLPFRAARRS
jgi:hypothetical protein